MSLTFVKPETIGLKASLEFDEKWVQERIIQDPAILGLGDIEVIMAEKPQPKAGRLDLLLYDEQLNRRYEVELMLGNTDPSHIIRSIEYWDIERRRYPAYDHVAVLVAENITSRFLNVLSLLAGSIPMIAIQMTALRIGDQIALHFAQVIDQTTLRTDDEYDAGRKSSGPMLTDRAYWEDKISPGALKLCDTVLIEAQTIAGEPYRLRYRKVVIDVLAEGADTGRLWLRPLKTLVRIGGYVPDPEAWLKRFEELGHTANLKRGNKAVLVSFTADQLRDNLTCLRAFLTEAISADADSDVG